MLATQLILLRVLLLLVHPPGLLAELDEDEDHSWKNVLLFQLVMLFFVVSVCVHTTQLLVLGKLGYG